VADQNVNAPKRSRAGRFRVFERALWSKWSKYTVSGLVFMAVGFIMIIVGILLNTASYAQAGLLVGGVGVIIVIVGIVRLLIGFINPASPEDLRPLEVQEEALLQSEAVDDSV
jgi:fatty acid desaturase